MLKVHLVPAFGSSMLREITLEGLQHYFARLQQTKLSAESVDKIRDVMSAYCVRRWSMADRATILASDCALGGVG